MSAAVAYRSHNFACPNCSVELVGYPERDKWRCRECVGVLAGPEEVPRELAVIDLSENQHNVRALDAPIGCPACGDAMQPLHVAHIQIKRCKRDGYIWFEAGQLGFLNAYIAEF